MFLYPRFPGNITKKLPRRTVVPVSDTVIFCVELEHPCSDAYWTRNGEKLKEDSRVSIACVVRQHTLTIKNCQADDSGEVAFVAGDCKTSTRFTVTGLSVCFTNFWSHPNFRHVVTSSFNLTFLIQSIK